MVLRALELLATGDAAASSQLHREAEPEGDVVASLMQHREGKAPMVEDEKDLAPLFK